MYIFKSEGFLKYELSKFGSYEITICKNMIEALKFYSSLYNILNNKDIFILDIGGNVGYYPSVLGRFKYTILSFEPFEKNNYVAKKIFAI